MRETLKPKQFSAPLLNPERHAKWVPNVMRLANCDPGTEISYFRDFRLLMER
jgi:hypothetical protein